MKKDSKVWLILFCLMGFTPGVILTIAGLGGLIIRSSIFEAIVSLLMGFFFLIIAVFISASIFRYS